MMAATWLVSSDPTPTPRIAKRAKTRIIPGATAGIWRSRPENDPPRSGQGDSASDHGDHQQERRPARHHQDAAVISLAPTNRGRLGVTRNDVVTVLCRNSLVTISVPSSRAKR